MSNISFSDFKKLDIRIGTVVDAQVPDWSHWVIKLTVDLGHESGAKIVFAGLLGFYEPKELVGKQLPFVVNMKPKKIGPKGDVSQGMMLAADLKLDEPVKVDEGEESDHKPVLLELGERVPNGTKVL